MVFYRDQEFNSGEGALLRWNQALEGSESWLRWLSTNRDQEVLLTWEFCSDDKTQASRRRATLTNLPRYPVIRNMGAG